MSNLVEPSMITEPSNQNELNVEASKSSMNLSELDLEELKKLPIDSLDTIRSKLVQLIDAITVFRSQLESSPLTPNTLSYPSLISKFLILLNHTEALSQALNTPAPIVASSRFELPSVRAEREEREKWDYGPSKQSILGNLAAVPRSLEGLEDGKECIIGILTRTKLAPEIEREEQNLLSLLPIPPIATTATTSNESNQAFKSLLEQVKFLTKSHETHIANCRKVLHKARYGPANERMEVDLNSDNGTNQDVDADPRYEWKMRVEVDDQFLKPPFMNSITSSLEEIPPNKNPLLKSLLRFMHDGTNPISQIQELNS